MKMFASSEDKICICECVCVYVWDEVSLLPIDSPYYFFSLTFLHGKNSYEDKSPFSICAILLLCLLYVPVAGLISATYTNMIFILRLTERERENPMKLIIVMMMSF